MNVWSLPARFRGIRPAIVAFSHSLASVQLVRFLLVSASREDRRSFMNRRGVSKFAGLFLALGVVSGSAAIAQTPLTVHFSGVINDYVPLNPTVKGSPWEMHGQWTLDLNRMTNTANFAADLTMSGYGKTSSGAPDPAQPGQSAHTHHIRLTNATVIWNPDDCPSFSPPTYGGFEIKDTVSLLTGNGSNAPFESQPPSSVLQVCVTGGENGYSITYSNIALVFQRGSPALAHFGGQTIHGVVRDWKSRVSLP